MSSIAVQKSGVARPTFYTYGKGRIALYNVKFRNYRDEGEPLLRDWTVLGKTEIPNDKWRGFEYAYAHLTDTIRWAANRESPITVSDIKLNGRTVTIQVANSGKPLRASARIQERTRNWVTRAISASEVEIPAGQSVHTFELNKPPLHGALALEVSLHNAETKKSLAFASAAANGGNAAVTVKCTPLARPRGNPGKVNISLKNHGGAGTLWVTVADRFGRVIQKSKVDVADAQPVTRSIPISGRHAVDYYHEISPEFIPAGQTDPIVRGFGRIILTPEKQAHEYRYVAAVAGSPERKVKHIQGMLAACRSGNLELHTHSTHSPGTLYRSGGYSTAYQFTRAKRYKLSKKNEMKPPLYQDETKLAARKKAFQKGVRSHIAAGARVILLDDERRFAGEWDFSKATLDVFRRYLQDRYKTIAALNESWDTAFTSFDSVMPMTRAQLDAEKRENRASWLEHRMFCGEMLAQNHLKLPHDWTKEVDPELTVGELGIYAASPNYPVDWARYAKFYENTQRYALADVFRSFAPQNNYGKWSGYGWTDFKEYQRPVVWENLFDGGHWIYFWEMRSSGHIWYAAVTSDLRLTEPYQKICSEELPDIQGGLDQMIIASTDIDQDIAVAYSYPSLMLGGEKGRRSPGIAGASTDIMRTLGYTYRFIDLKSSALASAKSEPYGLFVVQHISCMNEDEMKHIEAFATAGRPVLVVGRAGWLNNVGSVHKQRAMGDRLCGIDTSASQLVGKPVSTSWNGKPISLVVERSGVRATDADILIKGKLGDSEQPIFTRRKVGKGHVYWLNSTLDGQAKTFAGGIAGEEAVTVAGPKDIRKSHMAIYNYCFNEAGIRQSATVFKDNKQVESGEVWTYMSPSRRSRYIALCPHRNKSIKTPVDRDIRFAGEPAHVYNLRTQAYLGRTNTVEESCALFRMKVFALLPYQVTGLKATADKTAAPGDLVSIRFELNVDAGEPDQHGIRVRLTGPDGAELDAHKTVLLAPKGSVTYTFPLALNAPLGLYTVSAVDCVSGSAAETKITVSDR